MTSQKGEKKGLPLTYPVGPPPRQLREGCTGSVRPPSGTTGLELRRYYDRLAVHLCGRCGKVQIPRGIVVCPTCRQKDEDRRHRGGQEIDKERRRKLRASRVRYGRCANCAKPSPRGFKICPGCRSRQRAYYETVTKPTQARFRTLVTVCRMCRRVPEKTKTCNSCKAMALAYYYRRGKALRQNRLQPVRN